MPKNAEKFICKTCDFICCKKSNWDAHTSTQKHKRLILANFGKQEKCHIILNQCLCGKIYKHTSSLCKHKKSCSLINDIKPDEEQNNTDDKGLIYKLLKQNNELQNQIVEICKNNSNIVNNNNIITTNSHNKTFNMNVFLNEHCKNAMNLSDFID